MVLFWHNLLATQSWEVFVSKASYQYIELLRTHSLGNYRKLIKELTVNPAMLLYLNNANNIKDAPDENFARELQELFSVGKGAGSGYTESDVFEAARVLTGWTLNWETFYPSVSLGSEFASWAHDTGDKQFSSFYGNRIITGKAGEAGAEELDALIDMILGTEETAKYICRRLYQFFVFAEIDDATENLVIEPLANIFRANDYEILPVLQALFSSEHFYDEANFGAMIKNPIDFTLGLLRSTSYTAPRHDDLKENFYLYLASVWHMANFGMEIGDPPNVAGWPAYYQAPQFDQSWVTTSTVKDRTIVTDSLVHWGYWYADGQQVPMNLLEVTSQLSNPSNLDDLIGELGILHLGILPTQDTVARLKSILLSGQENEQYWTQSWNSYVANPSETTENEVLNRLKPFYQAFFQLGEFHLH